LPGIATHATLVRVAMITRWRRLSRETRLLLATITISAIALIVLGRFRFPAEDLARPAAVPAPALERLAALATYEELAGIIARLETRIRPTVVVLRVRNEPSTRAVSVGDLLEGRDRPAVRFVPALLVRSALAVAILAAADEVEGAGADGEATLVVRDPLRSLALVRVRPQTNDENWRPRTSVLASSPSYVVAAEAARHTVAIRPVLIGSRSIVGDSRWGPSLGSVAAPPGLSIGTLIFGLDAAFVGLVVSEASGAVTVAPFSALESIVARLLDGTVDLPGDLGLDVQSLTPALRAVTGATAGVIVARVDRAGPAQDLFVAGDVVESVDGRPVDSALAFLDDIATRAPGTPVSLARFRGGRRESVSVTVAEYRPDASSPSAPEPNGLAMRPIQGVGSELIRVDPGTLAARAGFVGGDIIVAVNGVEAPTPTAVVRALRRSVGPGTLVVVQRAGRHLVLAWPVVDPSP